MGLEPKGAISQYQIAQDIKIQIFILSFLMGF